MMSERNKQKIHKRSNKIMYDQEFKFVAWILSIGLGYLGIGGYGILFIGGLSKGECDNSLYIIAAIVGTVATIILLPLFYSTLHLN